MRIFTNKCKYTTLFYLLMVSSIGIANNDIELRKYSAESLDRFWNNTVESTSTDLVSAYQAAIGELSAGDAEEQGRVEGAIKSNQPGNGEVVDFLIKSLSPRDASWLNQREISLHMYLNREAFYEAPVFNRTVTFSEFRVRLNQEKATLDARRYQAYTELAMIKLLKYHDARSIISKCRYLTSAFEFSEKQFESKSLTGRINPPQHNNMLTDLIVGELEANQDLLGERLVCQVKPVQSSAQIQQEIEVKVNSKIVASLNDQKQKTIDPIAGQLETFDTTLQEIEQINPKTKELLDFEQLVENSRANFDLIANDSFQVEGLINELTADKIQNVKRISREGFTPKAIEIVQVSRNDLIAKTRTLLENLESVYTKAPVRQRIRVRNLRLCNGLVAQFDDLITVKQAAEIPSAVFPGLGGGLVASKSFTDNYDGCLEAVASYLDFLQQSSSTETISKEFARYLNSLMAVMLDIRSGN